MQIPVQGGEDPPHLRHGGVRGAEPGRRCANCLSPQLAWAIRRRRSLARSSLCRAAVDVCSRPRNFSAAGSVGQRAPDLALSQSAAFPPHPSPQASHSWLRRAIGYKRHFIYVPTPLTLTYWIFKYKPHLTGIPSEIGVWVLFFFSFLLLVSIWLFLGEGGGEGKRTNELHSLFYYEKMAGKSYTLQ